MMWWFGHDGDWGMMIVGFVIWLLIFGGIAALVVWAITRATKRGGTNSGTSPIDIAKERYAKGEISKEQFEQIKRDLSS